jgi:protocatechuate 3,4-dioxygenase beta subunit
MRSGFLRRAAVLLAALSLSTVGPAAQRATAAPRPTPALTEGPYYSAGSPERSDLAAGASAGRPITITGTVYDLEGAPIAGAWLDFWQADGAGRYDNSGFLFRGHQFTDAAGRYVLKTVVPGEYTGRTRHIHLKLRAPGGKTLTTQIFFPGSARNNSDPIFERGLVVTMSADGKSGRIDFAIPAR